MRANLVISAAMAAFLSAAAPGFALAPQAKTPVRIHVSTDDTGDPDELANRRASVRDLASALTGKKNVFIAAADEDDAELVVEVIGRGLTVPRVIIGLGPRPGQSTISSGPSKAADLRARLTTRPGEIVDFRNKNKAADNPRGWKSAADDIADQIERWQRARVVRSPSPEPLR